MRGVYRCRKARGDKVRLTVDISSCSDALLTDARAKLPESVNVEDLVEVSAVYMRRREKLM